jgi:adenine-specific DNA-methyltransferase
MTTALRIHNDSMRQRKFGQFFTPQGIANLMASFFEARGEEIRLLDAGAGTGALTVAFVRQLCSREMRPRRIEVTAYEIDDSLMPALQTSMSDCGRQCANVGIEFSVNIRNEDFISSGSRRDELFGTPLPLFNAAIANPPYGKIRSDSINRAVLSSAGIETSNLYSAFVTLILGLLETGGEIVAITPRSFCNGPYFRTFREQLLNSTSLRRLHVFESRKAAFHQDDVLQENIIVHAVKGVQQTSGVTVSGSNGTPGGLVTMREVPFSEVITPSDIEKFIHFPENRASARAYSIMQRLSCSLSDLGLSVSTGRVVDFRARNFLRDIPEDNTVPLIYPVHFENGYVRWPRINSRKPSAIISNAETRSLLVPSAKYVLTKRFTAKEEPRRVVACIFEPAHIPASLVGFENHLNYFHSNGGAIEDDLAKGLAAFLNSTVVDLFFRRFSGHTQVNATDLRNLRFPSKETLSDIGYRLSTLNVRQEELDKIVEQKLSERD